MLPPLTPVTLLTSWTFDPLGAALAVALTWLYAAAVIRAHRLGARPRRLRTVAFMVLGVGTLVYATCGALAVYRTSLFWVAAVQAATLSAVTAMGLALGDPVTLAGETLGDKGARRLRSALTGSLPRILMFPLVSSLLAVASLIVVFFTGYLTLSVSHLLVREARYVQLLGTGLLVVLPLLGEDLLPSWCTHPVRALLGFADGLLDAIPGVLVMTAPALLAPGVEGFSNRSWGPAPALDQRLGGGAMIAVAEVVGLPLLAAIFVSWVRADDADARQTDAYLDAVALSAAAINAAASHGADPAARTAPPTSPAGTEPAGPVLDRPWWESDPRFSDRRS